MKRRLSGITLTALVCSLLTGCPPLYSTPYSSVGYDGTMTTTTETSQVVADTGGGIQYLYIPTTNIPTSSIQQVIINSADGQTYTLGAGQVQAVASGRVALSIPVGVTQGSCIVVAGGVTYPAIPFYVAQPMTTLVTTTVLNQSCGEIAGTWTGNISTDSDPNAVATAVINVGADCQSVSGFIHWEGPRIGSVDSTIAGIWDAGSRTLIAQDTQLFNVHPVPGGGFCPTARYQLDLSPDGRTLVGLNIVTERACAGQSHVYLQR